ncbi:hypothetical protein BDV38DRAFT_278050 [Aspergillus pseudotamarii]|uniref:Uncharacterized protein n=2 Tax=Aspergillus subgen. Circumdati TaxID=2720871 RepID=A0A5N6T817_ASPPS|nr:uncharacterized protein BDV38DRAFT_278050 [Aspergillus pseudotamarii]KAE8142524.1 hypothetical protein BDV38DRAFT_278050 [Aspergillus pseudotamarii]KAE8419213.1 hypothetical protein BDV36DRAFT_252131 [Aspergillus pseudocaelatus]
MKFAIATLAAAALAPLAAADFYIYSIKSGSVNDGMAPVNSDGFFFLNAPPDCNDVNNKAIFISSLSDVSGGRQGVRCKGCPDFEELEFNLEVGHYTIYKNRDYGLFTTDDKKVGQCNMDKSDHFQCGNPFSQAGDSIVHCTADFNADPVNKQ